MASKAKLSNQALALLLLCQALMFTSLEAIALPPPSAGPRGSGDLQDLLEEPANKAGTFQMHRFDEATISTSPVVAVVVSSDVAESRRKRGAEMVLLRAHICRQYKERGVPPPPRYKC